MRQLDLLSLERPIVTPDATRSEPRLWVRKMVIWKDPETIIRTINLRPGLNIVWSPDPADGPGGKGNSNALGHGSGKTLFCRLLRYCLGEHRFADEIQRQHIAYAFEKGMVGAEVVLEGIEWAILRPIGLTRRHFAVSGITLQDLITSDMAPTGMAPFHAALEEAILTRAVSDLIDARPSMAWLTTLAWLMRDQECRFDHVLDWRSPASDSDSPARDLPAAARLGAVRALLGAIVREEIALRERVDVMGEQHQTDQSEADRRIWEADRLRTRLARELELDEATIPPGAFGAESLRKAATTALARIAGVDRNADVSNIDALRSDLEEAVAHLADVNSSIKEAEAQLLASRRMIERIEAEQPGVSAELLAAEARVCPVCEVPIDHALANGCKISLDTPDFQRLRARAEQARRDLVAESERIAAISARKANLEQQRDTAQPDVDERRAILRAAEKARDNHATDWFEARRLVGDANRLISLLADNEQLQRDIEEQLARIERDKETLAAFRDQQASVFGRLTTFFAATIERLVPTASGRVGLDGNGLKLSVELGGDRSTVAIDSLKVIAFDLAAMCMSIEGGIALPAFLVHDSPREADLGLSVYDRLFEYVHSLESDGRTPLFQYIVTTTTRPPRHLAKKPWLVETLRGTPAEERLLQRNL